MSKDSLDKTDQRDRGWAVRVGAAVVGLAALAAGAVAVFATANGTGSAALVAAGVALLALAILGERIESLDTPGVKLKLYQASRRLSAEADAAEAAGDMDAAARLRAQAEQLRSIADPIAIRYEALRRDQPSGLARTIQLEAQIALARDVARQGSWDRQAVRDLFDSGSDGMRIFALGLMEEDPSLAEPFITTQAMREPRSAFEQYHALRVAERLARSPLDPQSSGILRSAAEEVVDSKNIESDRRTVAETILQLLDGQVGQVGHTG